MAYIERDKALLELQKFSFDTSNQYGVGYSDCLTAVEDVLNDLPTADVVEVVRCKDCKYLERTDCFGECSLFNDRGDPRGEMSPNDFCSYGKRRKE